MQNGYKPTGGGALAFEQFEFGGGYELAPEGAGRDLMRRPAPGSAQSSLGEAEMMELAVELMEVANEAELENFLGKLIRSAWRGIRKVAGGVLRPLGGVLKAVAKRALPFLAGAAGTFFGGPAGGALGATLGSAISKALELEYEALEQEDREFEMARSFVRLANDAARRAALTPPNIDPQIAVRDALLAAVRRLTPGVSLAGLGLGQGPLGGSAAGATRSARLNGGRWVRNGRTIVLIGA